jgi:SEC-C motif/galactosyl transferase GMA12/MNN10 family
MSNVAIIQFDDRSDQELGPLKALIARNGDYAKMHGYHHVFLRQTEKELPPYWYKVYLLEKYLSSGFDIAVWLDTDAVIHDLKTPIESFFAGNEAFVYSDNLPIWKSSYPFNSGILFCKGEFGRALMQEWLSLYPAHLWEKKENEWICKDSRWAGPAYEQGSFMDQLMPKYRSHPALRQLSWKKLQNPYPLKDAFTLHFQQSFRLNCLLYLNDLAEMFGLSGRPAEAANVRRNDPCPCGSGKKYKHCHGRYDGSSG